MIDVALLGTGGMMPLPHRWLSSLLIRVDGQLTLFDCGEGTQIAWRAVGWRFRRLGTICISHTHADHVAGLPGLLHTVANAGRTEAITLYGPVGTAAVVQGLRVIAPALPYELHTIELSGEGQFDAAGGLLGKTASGGHSLPVLAYRVDLPRRREFLPAKARALGVPMAHWGTLQSGQDVSWPGGSARPDQVLGPPRAGLSVAYVTDTRPTNAIATLVAGVDLLVCEGTYGCDDDQAKAVKNQHMTFREAATLARDAGAHRLWLTHFSPSIEDPGAFSPVATGTFPGAIVGTDGLMTSMAFP